MKYNLNKDYWKKRYETYGSSRAVGCIHWNPQEFDNQNKMFFDKMLAVLKESNLIEVETLLDLGCGVGRCTPFLSKTLKPKKYLAYDILAQFPYFFENYDFRLIGEDGNLSLKERIQFAWTYVVLQHVIDDEMIVHYFRQIYDALTRDGSIIITERMSDFESSSYLIVRPADWYLTMLKRIGFHAEVKMSNNITPNQPHVTILGRKV